MNQGRILSPSSVVEPIPEVTGYHDRKRSLYHGFFTMTNLITDQTFHWKGFGNGFGSWESRCRLRIVEPPSGSTVVVVSDQGMDTGTFITNCAASLATLVVQQFQLDPEDLIWIEHYPDSDVECSRVEFVWQGNIAKKTHWSYLPPQQAIAIAGISL